jgi:hypothetical protein
MGTGVSARVWSPAGRVRPYYGPRVGAAAPVREGPRGIDNNSGASQGCVFGSAPRSEGFVCVTRAGEGAMRPSARLLVPVG